LEDLLVRSHARVLAVGVTDVGKKRNHNEDSFAVLDREHLYMVADGMGGHASGEVASRMAIDTVKEFFESTNADPEGTWPYKMDKTRGYEENRVITGIKLANPDKTVIGVTGDGGSMYTIQALWTAAHHGIGAKFVICNNRSYMLLKENILQYWRERGLEEHTFPSSFDLTQPDIRFDKLAESMGVPGVRVETADQIAPAIDVALSTDGPFLIDLVVDSRVPGSNVAVGEGVKTTSSQGMQPNGLLAQQGE
jgi:hypothetical protein